LAWGGGYIKVLSENINMKRVNGTKNPITHQELGDVFEYCFWHGECKTAVKTLR
jgi:hypothetical protein